MPWFWRSGKSVNGISMCSWACKYEVALPAGFQPQISMTCLNPERGSMPHPRSEVVPQPYHLARLLATLPRTILQRCTPTSSTALQRWSAGRHPMPKTAVTLIHPGKPPLGRGPAHLNMPTPKARRYMLIPKASRYMHSMAHRHTCKQQHMRKLHALQGRHGHGLGRCEVKE